MYSSSGHPRCRWICFFIRSCEDKSCVFVRTSNRCFLLKCEFIIYIYIYAFSRHFYPKRLALHSSYSFTFYQLLLSLGIEPMILALLAPCSTIWATGKLIIHNNASSSEKSPSPVVSHIKIQPHICLELFWTVFGL